MLGAYKKHPQAVEKRTSVYAFQRQVFWAKNLLLRGTTAIRGGSDTSRTTYSSGTDAAGSIRSDVSAMPKLVAKTIHGCIVLV